MQCGSCFLLYCRRLQRYQWHAVRLLLLTIFLAVTAISVACSAALASYLLFCCRRERHQWHAVRLLLLTIFLAVTATSVACSAALASYYILGGDSDISGMQSGSCFLLYSWR